MNGLCGNGSEYCDVESRYSGGCDSDNGGSSLTGECGPNFAGNKDCKGGVCCSEFKIEITHGDGKLFWALYMLSNIVFIHFLILQPLHALPHRTYNTQLSREP